MEQFAPYTLSLVSVAVFALMMHVQNLQAGVVKSAEGFGLLKPPMPDYASRGFRATRSHANSVENFAPFAASVMAAAMLGASAVLVNVLAVAFVLARIAYWGIYIAGSGKPEGGLRSMLFGLGYALNVALALVAIANGVF